MLYKGAGAWSRLRYFSLSNKLSRKSSVTMSFDSAANRTPKTQRASLPVVSTRCTCARNDMFGPWPVAVMIPMCSCHQVLGGCVAHHAHVPAETNQCALNNTAFGPSLAQNWAVNETMLSPHEDGLAHTIDANGRIVGNIKRILSLPRSV